MNLKGLSDEVNSKLLITAIERELKLEIKVRELKEEIEQLKKEVEELKQRQTIPCTPIIVPITTPTDKGPSDCPDSGGWQPYRPWQEWYTVCLSD